MQINPVLSNPDNWSYYVHDHQGNTRVVLDDAGGIKSWYDYYPYGLIQRASIAGSDARFKFTGKEFDSEDDFDMYSFGARYYDPEVARWFVTDLANQYHSPYVYVENNPLNYVDPTGLFSFKDFLSGWISLGINIAGVASCIGTGGGACFLGYADLEAGNFHIQGAGLGPGFAWAAYGGRNGELGWYGGLGGAFPLSGGSSDGQPTDSEGGENDGGSGGDGEGGDSDGCGCDVAFHIQSNGSQNYGLLPRGSLRNFNGGASGRLGDFAPLTNSAFLTYAGFLSEFRASRIATDTRWRGFTKTYGWKWFSNKWAGNQYVLRRTAAKTAEGFRSLGRKLGVAGVGISLAEAGNAAFFNKSESNAVFYMLDVSAGMAAVFGGPPGITMGGSWFLLRFYYTEERFKRYYHGM